MSKHTKEPWSTGVMMTRVEIWPKNWNAPLCVADCHAKNAPETETERVANAARIVACVNGCTGLNPAAYRECVTMLQVLQDSDDLSLRMKQDIKLALAHATAPETP